MIDWQPIETAPHDGTPILTWLEGDWPEAIVWQDYPEDIAEAVGHIGFWRYADELLSDVMDAPLEPTHWMPLPPAPSRQKEGA